MATLLGALLVAGCNKSESAPKAEADAPAPVASAAPSSSAAPPAPDGALHLGTPIETKETVALSEIAKNPQSWLGKTFATTGTVTAVCQHMGCWMEIKDDASEAHIKMAGHTFFVPKTASGRRARVLATLEKSEASGACEEGPEGMSAAGSSGVHAEGKEPKGKSGCRAEAEAQLGRPLAKLELVAQGVELM